MQVVDDFIKEVDFELPKFWLKFSGSSAIIYLTSLVKLSLEFTHIK